MCTKPRFVPCIFFQGIDKSPVRYFLNLILILLTLPIFTFLFTSLKIKNLLLKRRIRLYKRRHLLLKAKILGFESADRLRSPDATEHPFPVS